jgi:hypothetical protein
MSDPSSSPEGFESFSLGYEALGLRVSLVFRVPSGDESPFAEALRAPRVDAQLLHPLVPTVATALPLLLQTHSELLRNLLRTYRASVDDGPVPHSAPKAEAA